MRHRRVFVSRVVVLLWMGFFFLLSVASAQAAGRKKKKGADKEEAAAETPFNAKTFQGLALRGIGPALTSGRIVHLAVNPTNPKEYYVAAASGGVWKTTNAGVTWKPIFDSQESYSIGCITLDPNDPLIVWVGTGENNSQRSVSYGDGVYRSLDGGTTWKNVGLSESEHIARIVVDPRDSDVVYVAAQGPLWRSGGERGLYKSTDGGESWEAVLTVDEHTGVTDLVMDPRNPDVLYAAAYQRRRRVWTLINGGPGSALYKSRDAGAKWTKLENGLPKEEMGRIGLALSPAAPDVVYAIIEAAGDAGGFFRSTDGGSSWHRQSEYLSSSPQYYQEIVADPRDPDRVYSLDTWMQVTEDGGKTFQRAGQSDKHVDEHALWIDPDDTDHLLSGGDGGLYESFDRGKTWDFKANLPLTQFYKITTDNDVPFYNVYGGTQDNFTLGGPSRTTHIHGITNREWFVTLGGDGFQPRVDPQNPDIVYAQSQYGNLARYDRSSGEVTDIQPQPAPGEAPLRWNWDSPLLLSPHSPTRLYYGAQRVFQSDDRGQRWQAISPDLTRQIDRNELPVMDKVWSVDAVAKNASTSFYGTLVSLEESPLEAGLLYAGTDDGLVQVREPETSAWRRIDTFPGVPERSYVRRLLASQHEGSTVYAAFDDHKSGDFRPYVLKSTDRGATWTSITGDLPERGSVHALAEDHEAPSLLFAGTEFGVFFSLDGGGKWVQLKGGIPTIAVRDLAIQKRENDLVAGTFGRGIFILDDYTPLRHLTPEDLETSALLFADEKVWMFMPSTPLGSRGKGFQGTSFYTAPNPPFGATFTYYLKEEPQSRKEKRRAAEKKAQEAGEAIRYPDWESLRAEDREEKPEVLLTVADPEGNVVRRLSGPTQAGFHRVTWDLRYPAANPTSLQAPRDDNPFRRPPTGPMVTPGEYRVSLAQRVDGELTPLAEPRTFTTTPLGTVTLEASDRQELLRFQRKTARLQRAVLGAVRAADEAKARLDHLQRALVDTPDAPSLLREELRSLERQLADLRVELEGDRTVASRNEPTPPSVVGRVQQVVSGHWSSSSAPTQTHRDNYEHAAEAFAPLLTRLRSLVENDLPALEEEMEAAGAPWTPGRVPRWQRE